MNIAATSSKLLRLTTAMLCAAAFSASAEEATPPPETLTVDRCIAIALERQPSLAAAQGALRASESRIGQARAAYFPQLSASAGYSRIKSSTSRTTTNSNGVRVEGDNPFDQYSGTLALNQLLFDFGKTPTQVAIQRLGATASRSDYENTRLFVIFNVRQTYYNLLQSMRNREVARETVAQFEQHLEQAKGFFEVGIKPKFDVTRAEVDLSTARVNLIRADNAMKLARVSLNNAMGWPDAPEYAVEDSLAFVKKDYTLSSALETAFLHRPDLRAFNARVKAVEEGVSLVQKDYFPVITGSAAYNRIGEQFVPDEGWSAGVAVTIPLFSGFETVYKVREAEANLATARANEEVLRQAVTLEVQQAYLLLREAEERIPTADLAARQAAENLEIATGRYNAGVGSPIEVTDAQVAYVNARTGYIQALYDYTVALASLERAMGIQ